MSTEKKHIGILKLSSMGDLIHTLPAISDIQKQFPDYKLSWIIEERFAEIAQWHPAICQIIPTNLRQWKKNALHLQSLKAMRRLVADLKQQSFDAIIDLQGLYKTAILGRLSGSPISGYGRCSCREPNASRLYQQRFAIPRDMHAVPRMRVLAAKSLGYNYPGGRADYQIPRMQSTIPIKDPALIFFHGTTWISKCWPQQNWHDLAQLAVKEGFHIYFPWGNMQEKKAAIELSEKHPQLHCLPKMTLSEMAAFLQQVRAAVAVDTGFSHLAAAIGTPCITLFGASDPKRSHPMGPRQSTITEDFPCQPCLKKHCRRNPLNSEALCMQDLPAAKVMTEILKVKEVVPC
jgi:heptosyltransferase I